MTAVAVPLGAPAGTSAGPVILTLYVRLRTPETVAGPLLTFLVVAAPDAVLLRWAGERARSRPGRPRGGDKQRRTLGLEMALAPRRRRAGDLGLGWSAAAAPALSASARRQARAAGRGAVAALPVSGSVQPDGAMRAVHVDVEPACINASELTATEPAEMRSVKPVRETLAGSERAPLVSGLAEMRRRARLS